MHFEVPKAKSFKEFGGEYLMIVISILTALALEHGVQTLHHRHLADQASEKIAAELRINVQQIDEVLAHNNARVAATAAVRDELLAGIRDKVADEVLMRRVLEHKQALNLSIKSPTLRREAWETAVANQAVTWMPPAELERYSSAYASLRDTHSVIGGGSMSFIDGPRWRDALSNLQMGRSDPRDVFRMLNQAISAYGSLNGNLELLKRELKAAAGKG